MNILFCDMGSFTYRDVNESFIKKGHNVTPFYYHFSNKYVDEFFSERIHNELTANKYDFVFSVNFFPIISVACDEIGIPYLSWSYDSPLEEGFERYFSFNTNIIFLFDRMECEKYNKKGFNNVYHLPLAVNVKRLDEYKRKRTLREAADISFVGSLYKSFLSSLLLFADDYAKGYVEGLFQTQLNLYGANIISHSVTQDIVDRINRVNILEGRTDNLINKTGLCYAINSAITHSERVFLLNEFSKLYKVKYYGYDGDALESSVHQYGPVKYFSAMNDVFLDSTLNLCPTLRSIESGIPLRALDIVGCGATLFSNYQIELAEYFQDGVSTIMYSSIEDAFDKADFYVRNRDICRKIGIEGRKIAEEFFDYSNRVDLILDMVNV